MTFFLVISRGAGRDAALSVGENGLVGQALVVFGARSYSAAGRLVQRRSLVLLGAEATPEQGGQDVMRCAIDVHKQFGRPPTGIVQSGVDAFGSRRGRLQLRDA